MAFLLASTGLRWIRQARWKGRIFDFWCREKGIAVEVDGREHKPEKDALSDKMAYNLGRILVFRVRNMNNSDAQKTLKMILEASSWESRKHLT